ncbi:dimethylmenaquinone methyltransferase [Pseudotabrizicola sediminis]|uniref:Putative 4-hydroxy-4-methyl-2-oxoglutarate aldolase n=1 Tax=Pseudotabrizicola sediminis TaxID=2486418 RepID=A0ABY2KGG6_9RHOB|nr:dimethylmenaquinone methyltransferase [Pseudotabrizicola sediminis]TGD41239.1 dimethylmenaquinone methyltransferase [Pseudotabrizicola sediminis]
MPVTLHTPAFELTAAEIDRWSAIPVAIAVDLVCEAGQIDPALRPLRPAGQQPRLFGQAVTVRCEAPDFGAVLLALDVIERGQVLVIDAGGYREAAMIGDILSGHLRAKGAAGLICDGAVRDLGTVGGWDDFPVFARWINPRGPTGADRGAINLPVTIGGTSVAPGDLMIGDDDGLVSLSPIQVRTLIADAEAKLTRETTWTKALAAGKSAAEVFGLAAPIRG